MRDSALQDLTRYDRTLVESKAKRISVELGQEIIKEGARIDRLMFSVVARLRWNCKERPLVW
jgi:hypothetical protein